MRVFNFSGLFFLFLLLSCGCATNPQPQSESARTKILRPISGDERAIDIARNYAVKLLEAFRDDDYDKFIAQFNAEQQTALNRAMFTEVRVKMLEDTGAMQSYEFVCALDQTILQEVIYKVHFLKEAKDIDGNMQTVGRDALFRLAVMKIGDEFVIYNFLFS